MRLGLIAVFVLRLSFVFVSLILSPALARAQSPQLSAQIDALIDHAYNSNEPGGVVLVAKHGKVIYERAFGLANLEWSVPMPLDAVFSIASLTKQFTAVAALQQIEKGVISLTDTVGKFAPDLPTALKGVTIEQLLRHTGGVPNAKTIESLLAVGRGWLTAKQVINTFKDQPLDFAPGTRWNYSNSGYQLLGYVLEKVTGEPFPEFIEKTLLQPAGMTNAQWGNDMRIVPHRASPYLYTRAGVENAMNPNIQVAWAAGAIQATARDFLKWHQSLVAGLFIKRETLQDAWTAKPLPDGSPTYYGYGWFTGVLQGRPLVEHGGNAGGFMSHVLYLTNDELLVEVFLNSRGKRLPELIATDIAATALGRPLNIRPVSLPDEVLQSYAGRFRNKTDAEVNITLENGQLFYQRKAAPKWRIVPYAMDKVMFDNTSTIGEFQRDDQGRIKRLVMQTLRGQDRNEIVREDSVPHPH